MNLWPDTPTWSPVSATNKYCPTFGLPTSIPHSSPAHTLLPPAHTSQTNDTAHLSLPLETPPSFAAGWIPQPPAGLEVRDYVDHDAQNRFFSYDAGDYVAAPVAIHAQTSAQVEQTPEPHVTPEALLGVPSRGSSLHASGDCKPCAWFHKASGCKNGQECGYCHICPEGELKHRRKEKIYLMRAGALTPVTCSKKRGPSRKLKLNPLLQGKGM